MKILFCCTSNLHRSRTAESLFSKHNQDDEFKSAGLNIRHCKQHNTQYATDELLRWADKIFVFEDWHVLQIMKAGDYYSKTVNLRIDDIYRRDDPKLVYILLQHASLNDFIN